MMLNLGAGKKHLPGYLSVDSAPLPGIDVLLDLDQAEPWPWPDNSVQSIMADNVFEHLHRPVWFMTECHRVLVPDGSLRIITPHYTSRDSWTDPTHLRHCSEDTFCYWVRGTNLYDALNEAYGGVAFDCLSMEAIRGGNIDTVLWKVADLGTPVRGLLAPQASSPELPGM